MVAWWCKSALGYNVLGEGNLPGACFHDNGKHTTLNEIQRTDPQSAFVSCFI